MRQANHPAPKSAIRTRLTLLGGAVALCVPMLAAALEIGVPTTNPVLGESLRLEIPLTLPAGSKPPANSCVRLMRRADDSEDDYFPKDMRASIESRRGGTMLVVSSAKGVNSPIIGFRVALECEAGVARDFMLLASQREVLGPAKNEATSTPAAVEAAPKPVAQNNEMVISHATTLNKMARWRFPASRETRDEYRRLIAQANPELFANAGDNVGSVPLPAGTILKLPAGLPKKPASGAKDSAERLAAEVPQASEGVKPTAGAKTDDGQAARPVADGKTPRKKSDRLVIGGGQGRVPSLSQQELKQSLDRLEQMMSEKSRGDQAMSDTLTSLAASFGEVKSYLQGVDERIKRAEAEQLRAQSELQNLREELHNSYSLVELLLAIIGGGALGAGLIVLGQRLAGHRQPEPYRATASADTPSSAEPARAASPAAAPHAPARVVAQPANTAAKPAPTPTAQGSRVEPTTAHNTIERAAAKETAAASQPIPDKFAALKKSSSEEPATPPAATSTASAEERLELELPKTESAADEPAAAVFAGEPALQLPATEGELELKLGEGGGHQDEQVAHASGVDPVIELADVMTSLGLAKEAASAVIEHIRQHPHQDPSHWFKVLDIYRSTGHREGFDEAVQELRQNLNVAVDDWGSEGSKSDRNSLEDYAHISRELQALWPKPESEEFLTKLLEDNRGGKRAGFPQSVAEEIVLLKAILRNMPNIDFPPIGGGEDQKDDAALVESKAWREVRLIP